MAEYFLIEFAGRISCRVYGTSDKSQAIAEAEARIQAHDGSEGILLDPEDLMSVERMED